MEVNVSLSSFSFKRSSPAVSYLLSIFLILPFLQPSRAYGFGFTVQSTNSIIISYLCPCTALEKMWGEASQNNWCHGVFTVKRLAHIDIWAEKKKSNKVKLLLFSWWMEKVKSTVVVSWCWENVAGEVKVSVITCDPYQAVLLWLNCFISILFNLCQGWTFALSRPAVVL